MLFDQWWQGRENKAAIAMRVSAGKTEGKAISLSSQNGVSKEFQGGGRPLEGMAMTVAIGQGVGRR